MSPAERPTEVPPLRTAVLELLADVLVDAAYAKDEVATERDRAVARLKLEEALSQVSEAVIRQLAALGGCEHGLRCLGPERDLVSRVIDRCDVVGGKYGAA